VTTKARGATAAWLPAFVADLVCVLVFAMAGKSSHEASRSEWVVLAIVWPFALSVVLAYAGLLARKRLLARVWPEGVCVVAVTYVLGMALRAISGRGIAGGFLVVAVLFLALSMLGWRLVWRLITRRRSLK
jgi:hypothetical protein